MAIFPDDFLQQEFGSSPILKGTITVVFALNQGNYFKTPGIVSVFLPV
jgi:hypothetical protein